MSRRKSDAEVTHQKPYTIWDHVELYGFFADENGKETLGVHRGLPIWVTWFTFRGPDSRTEDGDAVFSVTTEEQQAFPDLANVPQVIIRTEDWRPEGKGFRTFVLLPEGIPVPDYDAFWAERQAYVEARSNEEPKKRRKRTLKSDKVTIEPTEEKNEPVQQQVDSPTDQSS